jgi:hypothetical protein
VIVREVRPGVPMRLASSRTGLHCRPLRHGPQRRRGCTPKRSTSSRRRSALRVLVRTTFRCRLLWPAHGRGAPTWGLAACALHFIGGMIDCTLITIKYVQKTRILTSW